LQALLEIGPRSNSAPTDDLGHWLQTLRGLLCPAPVFQRWPK
jgi:hypothetical protein